MMTLVYATTAIVFLLLILRLLVRAKSAETSKSTSASQADFAVGVGDTRWLDLSERIFDPSDVRWLCEDLAFPVLAKSLAQARKQLAIGWLKALQASFEELVRTPEFAPSEEAAERSAASWKLLWLTLRFQLLLSYALLVVRLFGPYHRLIPSFSWIPFPAGRGVHLHGPALVDDRNAS